MRSLTKAPNASSETADNWSTISAFLPLTDMFKAAAISLSSVSLNPDKQSFAFPMSMNILLCKSFNIFKGLEISYVWVK